MRTITNKGCIPQSITKDGRTLKKILEDIEKEKSLELRVLGLSLQGVSAKRIASKLGITHGKALHIIKFDKLGLSYRKIGK